MRKVWRCGWPGLHASIEELGKLTGRCERSVQNALTGLGPHRADCAAGCVKHLALIRRIPVFEAVTWTDATGRIYQRRQRPNIFVLTARAPLPGRPRRHERPAAGRRAHDLGSVPAHRRTSQRTRSFERKNLHPYSFPFLRKEKGWSGDAPGPSPDRARGGRPPAATAPPEVGVGFADGRSAGRTAGSDDPAFERWGLAALAIAVVARESARSSELGESVAGRPAAGGTLDPPMADNRTVRPALSREWAAELARLELELAQEPDGEPDGEPEP